MSFSRLQGLLRSLRSFSGPAFNGWIVFLPLIAVLLSLGCSSPRGVYHTVRSGQTLYRIGQTYGIDARYLARVNSIEDPSQLRVGAKVFIPGARRVRYVPSTVKSSSSPAKKAVTGRRSSSVASVRPAKSSRQSRATTPKKTTHTRKTTSSFSDVRFIWPVRGKLVKSFGQQGYGGRKGIEIEVRQGQNIVAAAAGRVTYSGNGIKGYGNLIILKHAEDLFSVYGFNKKNLVDVGAYVSKGERIALAGVPPGCRSSRLHFEIRHGKDALNPVAHLP